ncbi:MAG: glutamate--tRNA ligase [Rhizobiaceae bacterium]|nr:glutamate--tRNA ligase [Rhizobiaceae bacterium]MCV0408216.1 glutamate--tRNA ligase [Rhizobiaceae bacterium]
MNVAVRFAPSPTGLIHIGNARTALFNWLFALRNDGRFVLRFDDTDCERSKPEFAEAIEVDLRWLGVIPDTVEHQSARFGLYDEAVERLKAAGLLYACYETPEELELKRKVLLSRRLPPVYGREALTLSDAGRARLEAEGRRPHWRFLLPNHDGDPSKPRKTLVAWDDLVRGRQSVDLASLSDPVLVREDGSYLYTLPSVVDDIAMAMTHVIRGDDHVTNTGAQIALFRALGAEPPVFGHHNLLTSATGEGLSKRTGALSIRGLREQGMEPMAVASLAVLTGGADSIQAVASMRELAERLDLARTSRSSSKFDPIDLERLTQDLLRDMPFAAARERLAAYGVTGEMAEPFWLAVRGNLSRLDEAALWWRIVTEGPDDDSELIETDRAFVRAALDALPPEPWDATTWKTWTDGLKQATGRKGRALYMPLRIALTGRPSGPELADLLPLLGREGTLARRP